MKSVPRARSRFASLFLAMALAVLAVACKRAEPETPPVPPVSHILAREFIGYGVVTASFAHLFTESGGGGLSLGYLRRGTIVNIVERRQMLNRESLQLWLLAEESDPISGSPSRGWIAGSLLAMFDHKAQAETAANELAQ